MPEKFFSPEFSGSQEEEKEQELRSKTKEDGVEIDSPPDDPNGPEDRESLHEIERSIKELQDIEEIHGNLGERERASTPQWEETPVIKNPTEIAIVHGQQYTIEYVPQEEIYPAFGYGGGDRAIVRQDLSPCVKRFVKAHELYHCYDQADWGGWLGREVRANVVPGLKDPIGLLSTVWATISDFERIKFYVRRTKERW